MAGKSLIGALRVFLGLDTAEFTQGVKHAESQLSGFVDKAKGALGALAVAFASKAMVEGFLSIEEHLDNLGKTAQKIGIPVAELSKLEYAAKLADVPLESLQGTIAKFSKGLSEFEATGNSKTGVGEALRKIGVSADDANGHLKPQIQLIGEIADKFAGFRDGANKTALAMALFGKTGAEMIPLLNAGKNGIADAAQELERFGGVADERATKAAEQFNDNLTRLKTALYSVAQQAVIAVNTGLTPLTDAIVEFVGTKSEMASWGALFTGIMLDVRQFTVETASDFQNLGLAFKYLTKGYGSYDFGNALFHQDLDENNRKLAVQIAAINDLRSATKNLNRDRADGAGAAGQKQKPDAPPLGGDNINAAKALTDHLKALRGFKDEAKRVIDETRTPLEKYNAELARLNLLNKQNLLPGDTFARAIKAAGLELVQAQDAMQNFGDSVDEAGNRIESFKAGVKDVFGGMFHDIINGSFDAGKALDNLISKFLDNAFQSGIDALFSTGAGHPLYGGGGGGGIFGAIGNLLGFATGGTIMPGGSGGVDSQIVAFRKSPDERVDITRPGQRLVGGGSSPSINIHNYGAPQGAQVTAQQNGDGIDIMVMIDRRMQQGIASGRFDSEFGGRLGLGPVRTRR